MSSTEERPGAYMAIDLESVRSGTMLGFDLYIRKHPEGASAREEFVLYRGRDLTIRREHICRLREAGVRELFIRTVDRKGYRRYLEDNLKSILRARGVDDAKKPELLYESAAGLAEDVMRNPTSEETIARSTSFVDTAVHYVLKKDRGMKRLVAVMSHSYTLYTHAVNVCLYSLALGARMGMDTDAVADVALGGMLHDVGKTRLDERLVNKRGFLTRQEWVLMKRHPQYGADLIAGVHGYPDTIGHMVLEHHEKCDGSGYPQGLRRDLIHPGARIACLADIFDSLTTDRLYQPGVSAYEALRVMRDEMDGSFDTTMWKQFVLLLGVEE